MAHVVRTGEPAWIVVDGGDIFEGTLEQFANCFFTNTDANQIVDWAMRNGHTVTFVPTAPAASAT